MEAENKNRTISMVFFAFRTYCTVEKIDPTTLMQGGTKNLQKNFSQIFSEFTSEL